MNSSIGSKIWRVLYPCLVYFGITVIVGFAFAAVTVLTNMDPAAAADETAYEVMLNRMTDIVLENSVYITLACDLIALPFLFIFIKKDITTAKAIGNYSKFEHITPLGILACALTGIGLCLTENNLLEISGIMGKFSKELEALNKTVYQGGIVLEILVTGIIAPVMEEILFRGLVLKRLNEYVRPSYAVLISSMIFAAFHGNTLQMIYALVFGTGLACLYNKYRTVWAPIAAHCAGNLVSVILTETAIVDGIENGSAGHIIYIIAGAAVALVGICTVYYMRPPKEIISSSTASHEAQSQR